MTVKRLFLFFFVFSSISLLAQDLKSRFNFYGFVRSDFYYNTRQNVEVIDGVFHIFPMPENLDENGKDLNAKPQAEMISVASRVGIDVMGMDILGAKSMAKLEADFAGSGSTYFFFRLRQAYFKLNWESTELLVGQTWHPLFGSVMPMMMSLNTGAPFNPFNRSPQIRIKQHLGAGISLQGAATYQMQYTSPGPNGFSNAYQKNAIMPNLFLGLEGNLKNFTAGIGGDFKRLKPNGETNLNSFSAVAYAEYALPKFQVKVKGIWGQNMSDHLMANGYGLSYLNDNKAEYTNFGISTAWLNITYGNKWKVGVFGGWSQNLGTDKKLITDENGNFTFYGRGYYMNEQVLMDRLLRASSHVSYNLPKFSFGLEYDFTSALYGEVNQRGKINNPYTVNNHRIVASVIYNF